jgi:hypothetical protein
LFFWHGWVHFGFPTSIVFDQDSHFLGKFWSTLWELMDTKLRKSTAFHPQIDGKMEVVNKKVIHLLQGYCNKFPNLWYEQFYYVQHAYNNAIHSSTMRSPFETCFGYFPRSPLDLSIGKDSVEDGCNDPNKDKKFIQEI